MANWFDNNNDNGDNNVANPFDNNQQQGEPQDQQQVQPESQPQSQPVTDNAQPESSHAPESPAAPAAPAAAKKPKKARKHARSSRKKGLTKAEIREAADLLAKVRGSLRPAVQTLVRGSEKEDDVALAAALAEGKLSGALSLADKAKGEEGTARIITLVAAAQAQKNEDWKRLVSVLHALAPDKVDPKASLTNLVTAVSDNLDAIGDAE